MTARHRVEARRAVDHPQDLHDAHDVVERSQLAADGREQLQADDPSRLVGFGDVEVVTDLPGDDRPVRPHRTMAGHEQQVAGAHGADVVAPRRQARGQVDLQLAQSFLSSHGGAR